MKDSFIDQVRFFLAKLYLRAGGKKLIEVKEITFEDNKTKKVFVFEGDSMFPAQNLPLLNVILMQRRLFSDYSENVQKFILEHEYAHGKQYLVTSLLLIPLMMMLLGVFSGFAGMIVSIVLGLILNNANIFYNGILLGIGFLVSALFVILLSWPMEFYADYTAFNAIGLENAEKAYAEMKSKSRKISLFRRVVNRLTHPPTKWNLEAYRRLNR